MAALVAAIHVFASSKAWMRGTSPRMTIVKRSNGAAKQGQPAADRPRARISFL
jgi:hypothetical protein